MSFSPGAEGSGCFNVVIVYEDFQSGTHGLKTYNYLARNLGKQCEVANQMWKFDILVIPSLRDLARRDAARADIIVVACRGNDLLPEAVTTWLEGWSRQPGHALALVALFEEPHTEQAGAVRGYLTRVARRAGVEFFAQPDDWPGNRDTDPMVRELASGKVLPIPPQTNLTDHQPSRWGINE